MTRTTLAAVLATAATLVAPAVAQAATTISWSSAQLAATTDSAGDSVSLSTYELRDPDTFEVVGTFPAFSIIGAATYPTSNCVSDGDGSGYETQGYVVCDWADSFLLQGAGGVDTLSISDDPGLNPLDARLNGAGGNDQLRDYSPGPGDRELDGGDGNDVMFGSDGDDILRGGPGNDEVDGEGGSDNVSGGDGDDKLFGDHFKPIAPDVVDGGPGFDRVEDDWGAADGPVTLTLNGVADDGRAGEGDNVIGVESIEAAHGTFVGSDAAETFVVGATGQSSSVSGGGGNDTITTANGPDTVDGGPGDDRITSGFDNDTVTGGPGRDAIFADSTGNFCGIFTCTVPFGNDTVNARDGEPDSIDCGVGADTAVTDTIDTAANCETNNAAGGGPGGGPGGSGAGSQLSVLSSRSIRRIARRGLRIRVACPARCTIRARLLTNRSLARRLRLGRSRQLASGRKTLRSAGTATVTLKVVKKARRRFRRLRRATVTLRVTRTGASTLSQRLRLRR
jgi:Ca2+-binding RTX toxin-like protein